jgi:hypothetical protein
MQGRTRASLGFLALGAGLCLAALHLRSARAEHVDIGLRLRTLQGEAQSSWDTSPPEGGVNPRQSVTAKVGEEVVLEWRARSEFPHGIMKNTGIRIYVAPEKEIGQKAEPPPDTPRVLDNSFVADFLPNHSTQGHVKFRVTEPGNYLVRLQSEGTLKEHGHEHFGALDLKVE